MSDPNVPTNPPGGPYFTQRLWSEEVAIALAESGEPITDREPSYEFRNGRKFVEPVNRVWNEGSVAPSLTVAPVITGAAYDGAALTCTTGSWSARPDPTYSYQWKSGVTNVGADQNTYVSQVGDIGSAITCTVTATNYEGSASGESNAITVTASASPSNTVAPVVSGSQPAGSTLSSTTGTWTANPAVSSYSYQWKADAGNVGTNQATYVTQVGDVGKSITCTVTATNIKGSSSQASNGVTVTSALAAPANTVAPVVSGDSASGSTLTSTTGTWTGNPTPTYAYQWKSDGSNVGSNQNTYVTQSGDVGKSVTCTVTATNSQGNSSQASNGITVTVSNPDAVIEALFASGEQGAWYDPSDINNYMGPELIVNGTFDSNTDGWIPIEATASVVGGKCVVTNTSNTWGLVATELQVTVGEIYALSIYFDTTSGYGAVVAIPGLLEDGISAGQTITYSVTVVADTNPLLIYIGNTEEVVGHNISFDNVSIRRIGEATMFQDAAGTTPVTAVGQPVGLILDKSKGLVLGPVVFSEDGASASDWVYPGTNGGSVAAVGGEIKLTCGNPLSALADRLCYSTLSGLAVGVTYKVVSSFRNITDSSGARISVTSAATYGDSTGAFVDNDTTVSSTKTMYFVATATTMYFRLIAKSGVSGSTVGLSSALIQSISGNHASQATAAARPLYKTSGLAEYTDYDLVDDVLNTTFPASLGSSCTVAKAVVGGSPTILTAQTIGTSWAESTDNAGVVIVNRALTGQETTDLTAWLTAKGATA